MAGETVLIAAFSGRALAQSARRAGYAPLVADAFGDLDTRAAAADYRIIDGAVAAGFNTKKVIAALENLAAAAQSAPVGLVLGSGFEDKPRLVAALGKRFRLLGSSAETIAACKEPARFFATLDDLGIAHPETQSMPPDDPTRWITKRVGGSGGRHIRQCTSRSVAKPRRYFQKQLTGERLSVGGLFFGKGAPLLALSRQWISPTMEQPFRFGGAVSQPHVDEALSRQLRDAAARVEAVLNLTGVASFDFIVNGDGVFLLEVNPRPGASLDVLDGEEGVLFASHIAAFLGGDPPSSPPPDAQAKAMAILHADRGALTLGETPWPEWSADRGAPGTFVPRGAPLASAFAEASTADAAEALARARLAELEDLIYDAQTCDRSPDVPSPAAMEPLTMPSLKQPSVSARAAKLVDAIVADADALRISVTKGSHGERLIDMGANVTGGLEAGRRLGEVCMGGLGTVAFTQSSGLPKWPLGVVVTSTNPVIACLASQYAGWTIKDETGDSGFFALGSGPARALSRVEPLFKDLGYADHSPQTALVIEGDKAPPPAVIANISEHCGINPTGLSILYATTWSLAGTVQIAARVLEVAIHKAHELHFPLENVLDGTGTTPIAPPVPDFVKAMGRTNDAIIYGGRIHLFVKGPDSDAKRLADGLPSSTCNVYGKPFAEIFADVNGDFYKIDPMLFSPAQVIVSNVETGNSFRAGELAPEIVDASFR